MGIAEQLTAEHTDLREKTSALRAALKTNDSPPITERLTALQEAVRKHFRREDVFFRILDTGKRLDDRGTMHQIRNDHAAIIFGLESLAIRLRKNGPIPEWGARVETLLAILLPHMEQEEKHLFPASLRVLSAVEIETIQDEMKRCG